MSQVRQRWVWEGREREERIQKSNTSNGRCRNCSYLLCVRNSAACPEEDADAIEAMVNSVLAAMQEFGVDLVERTTAVYLDGGKALTNVFRRRFPDATHVRCLQHVKKE
eukprot:9499894-Pyramimonas_sp.AAC.2